jgi:hypothetical protein
MSVEDISDKETCVYIQRYSKIIRMKVDTTFYCKGTLCECFYAGHEQLLITFRSYTLKQNCFLGKSNMIQYETKCSRNKFQLYRFPLAESCRHDIKDSPSCHLKFSLRRDIALSFQHIKITYIELLSMFITENHMQYYLLSISH